MIMMALIRLNGYALETCSILLVATVILVLVVSRVQKYHCTFY